MRGFKKNGPGVVLFVLFFSFTFSGKAPAAQGPTCSDGGWPLTAEVFCPGQKAAVDSRETEEMNPVCFLEAFFNLIVDLLEEDNFALSKFFSCLSGCFAGADGCDDTDPLEISPPFKSLQPGGTQTFTADGGEPPYTFILSPNNSGGSFEITGTDNRTAIYTAGATEGVDTLLVTDRTAESAQVMITVTENPNTNEFPIGPDGGTLSYQDLVLVFPEGALDTDTNCKISIEENPKAFPAFLESFSSAYQVELGKELLRPIKITFNNIDSAETGALGIYILEAGEWFYAGGTQSGNTVSSYVKEVSLFQVGKGLNLHKAFDFVPVGTGEATVSVAEFALTDPNQDAPVSSTYAIPVSTDEKTTAFFPLGKYRFCVEWENSLWQYQLLGSAVPASDNYILKETNSVINPPDVFFNLIADGFGRCEGCENKTE